jgi:dTDP-glucose 4,6-dehydratase
VRSFIHIRDVAEATLRIAQTAPPGECFHLSTPRNLPIRDLVAQICRAMGADFDATVRVTEDRPGKDAAYLLASAKARRDLGWSDAVSLEDGIAETIAWVDGQWEQIRRQPADYVHKA